VGLPMTDAMPGDAFEQILRSVLAQGFKAIKLCIDGFGHRDNSLSIDEWDRREARLLKFAREIVGRDIKLMLDAYGSDPAWSADIDWALKTADVLAALDYLWFEEPLAPGAIDEFVQLTERASVVIAGAEDFILLNDFERVSKRHAMNILQPDCTRAGGLTQMRAIRQLADQHGLHVIPHGWNTAIGLAADLQFQATVAGDRYCMVECRPDKTITDLLKNDPFALDSDGRIAVPTAPGLGVTLNEAFLSSL
jgi:D-galactarolactone cycloisomerase